MKKLTIKAWAALCAFACCVAHGGWTDEFAGLWLTPELPGWGLSIQQQGEHLAATILTYGADGKPKWYQARDITLPAWYSYILWDPMTVKAPLAEGGNGRNAGTIEFLFSEDGTSVTYVVDGSTFQFPVSRFVFAPFALQGAFTGSATLQSYGSCAGVSRTQPVRIAADLATGLFTRFVLTTADATCTVHGTSTESDYAPVIVGNAQCTGLDRISEAPFTAWDVRITRDAVSFGYDIGQSPNCGYSGRLVAARSSALPADATPPHDDASGLWDSRNGWSITAHSQGNVLFAMVLAPDGSWSVAPNAGYVEGQDGDFVSYEGDLWVPGRASRTARDFSMARAGTLSFTMDSGGYDSASLGPDGLASITRLAWPRDTQLSGSYLGVRTDLLAAAPPTPVPGNITIRTEAGVTGITLENENCTFAGALEWRGTTGRIRNGGGECMGTPAIRGRFDADDIRVTDQGVTMRYWFVGSFGAIAALRN